MGAVCYGSWRGAEGKSMGFGVRLDSDLCDLGEVTVPLWVSFPVRCDSNSFLAVLLGALTH